MPRATAPRRARLGLTRGHPPGSPARVRPLICTIRDNEKKIVGISLDSIPMDESLSHDRGKAWNSPGYVRKRYASQAYSCQMQIRARLKAAGERSCSVRTCPDYARCHLSCRFCCCLGRRPRRIRSPQTSGKAKRSSLRSTTLRAIARRAGHWTPARY